MKNGCAVKDCRYYGRWSCMGKRWCWWFIQGDDVPDRNQFSGYLKRYFLRIGICWRFETRRVKRGLIKAHLLDFAESLLSVFVETCSAFRSIFCLVFMLPLIVWRCIFIPIKHGSRVEEKLTDNGS